MESTFDFGGLHDPLIRNQVVSQVANSLAQYSRTTLSRQQDIDPRRNIDDECGYPAQSTITPEMYRQLYDRESTATRVVQVLPKESWQVQPSVFEDDDVDTVTAFEQAWIDLGESLQGETWYQDEEGSPVWEYLLRADELSGIGSYGIILMGIDDGKELKEPIAGFEEGTPPKAEKTIANLDTKTEGTNETKVETKAKLLYLRAFDESLAPIVRFETEKTSPRYGKPVMYSVTFNDPLQLQWGAVGQGSATEEIHWSRVIHVADNLGSSEVFGVPRMRPVFNRLLDLRKLYGGSAEMYWKGALPPLSWETHPSLGGDVLVDPEDMKDQIEQMMNGLQRSAVSTGMHANSLAPQVVDPTPQIEAALQAICIVVGIPKRVFVGSERGELASSEDKGTWNARLSFRQTMYLTPRLIVPFVDRLIQIGVLPVPDGYSVVWPDLDALTGDEKATVAVKITEALAKYVGGDVEAMMAPADYLTRVLGMTNDEAKEIIEAVSEAEERMTPDQAAIEEDRFEATQEAAAMEGEEGRTLAREGMAGKFAEADKARKDKDKTKGAK